MLDLQFIIAIAAGGLFLLLCLIALCMYAYRNNKRNHLQRAIAQMYSDDNLAKINYDFALYDEETAHMVSVSRIEGQLSIDDVLIDKNSSGEEGLEEITGNYKPD